MSEEEKIAPFTEFYKQVVFAEKTFDVNYKEVAKVLFNEVDRLNGIIDKAIKYIKNHNLDFKRGTTTRLEALTMQEKELLGILGGEEDGM